MSLYQQNMSPTFLKSEPITFKKPFEQRTVLHRSTTRAMSLQYSDTKAMSEKHWEKKKQRKKVQQEMLAQLQMKHQWTKQDWV